MGELWKMTDSIVEESSQVATCLVSFTLGAAPAFGTAAYWEEIRGFHDVRAKEVGSNKDRIG